MKNLRVLFAMMAVAMFTLLSSNDAKAQQDANVGQLVSGLITVNIGAIQVQDVIDVNNVLNDNEVRILNNAINNNEILSRNQTDLTITLRDIDVLTDSQIVVGVLSGGIVVVDEI